MSVKDKPLEKKKLLYNYLINPKVTRRNIKFISIFFPLMIIIGFIVALCFGGTEIPPGAYNIIDNYISDMGSHRYTPIPKFLDDSVMITAVLLVPPCFYIKHIFDLKSKQLESLNVPKAYSTIVLIMMLIGVFGIFSSGFISEDVAISLYPVTSSAYDLHDILSTVQFVGLASAGFLIGIILVRYPSGILEFGVYENKSKIYPILLGLVMIFLTPILTTLYLLEFPPSSPFWEWMLFFSLFGWILAIGIVILHQIKTEELN